MGRTLRHRGGLPARSRRASRGIGRGRSGWLTAAALAAFCGCTAMNIMPGEPGDSSGVDRGTIETRVASYFRKTANIPPDTRVALAVLEPAPVPGWQSGRMEITLGAHSESVDFMVSNDGRHLFRGEVADLTVDPAQANLAKMELRAQPLRGDPDAPVTIVEFSDFQCPYCARASKTIGASLLSSYPGRVKLLHKNLPLMQIHSWSEAAAVAGECAWQQSNDAFWKFYDDIFAQQKQITPKNLREAAESAVKRAGGNVARLDECFDTRSSLPSVRADISEAAALGVSSTPTFFINGRRIPGAQSIETFKAVIEEELARR